MRRGPRWRRTLGHVFGGPRRSRTCHLARGLMGGLMARLMGNRGTGGSRPLHAGSMELSGAGRGGNSRSPIIVGRDRTRMA